VIHRVYTSGVCKQKQASMISFKTISSASFRFYAHNFMTTISNGSSIENGFSCGVLLALVKNKNTKQRQNIQELRKKVPKLIHRWLTPISLAYWYMDDGSIKDKKSKSVYFHTQGFCFNPIKLLCEVLQSKFKLLFKPVKKREKYQIYISGKSYKTLKTLIYPYLINPMLYKFPESKSFPLPLKMVG
jgi:hypothetical protein